MTVARCLSRHTDNCSATAKWDAVSVPKGFFAERSFLTHILKCFSASWSIDCRVRNDASLERPAGNLRENTASHSDLLEPSRRPSVSRLALRWHMLTQGIDTYCDGDTWGTPWNNDRVCDWAGTGAFSSWGSRGKPRAPQNPRAWGACVQTLTPIPVMGMGMQRESVREQTVAIPHLQCFPSSVGSLPTQWWRDPGDGLPAWDRGPD